ASRLSALEVRASRATRETPVAYTNIEKADMDMRLGSRDIPMVMNTTPSVYATLQGGGAGDARVNVRGFNQQNVAIMINGVPVNDMENAWVYWSNWDGVGDATSSIQMQRGLSAVNLATPSIGGTMNIITDPSAHKAGGMFKQEFGEWGFLKSTLNFHSGLLANKFAFSGTLVKKTGDGFYQATWTDAYAYYFGASYQMGKNDRFEFYALGAPQQHGQNTNRQNIAVYSQSFAEDVYDDDVLNQDEQKIDSTGAIVAGHNGIPDIFDKYHEVGRDYNQNWNTVTDYAGKQYWAMYTERKKGERYDKAFLNERENFFHKPQVNLNWYHTFNDQMRLSSIVYWSGGQGGGTGTYGNVMHQRWEGTVDSIFVPGTFNNVKGKYYYYGSPWSWDWDATIAINRDSTHYWMDKGEYTKKKGESVGILRNSRNNQWSIGAISKFNYDLSDELKFTAGVDWRIAEIDHYREVRDLLGGDYFVSKDNDFDVVLSADGKSVDSTSTLANQKKALGNKMAYHFTNTVDWLGITGQTEYKSGPLAAYGMFGWSKIAYTYTNHFRSVDLVQITVPDTVMIADPNGDELVSAPPAIYTMQFKGGISYRVSNELSIFGNYGQIRKPPIFDFVIDDYAGVTNDNPVPETFTSREFGVHLTDSAGRLAVTVNYYRTMWEDRNFNVGVVKESGEEGLVSLRGVDSYHSGYEVEASFQPGKLLRIDMAGSFGDWIYTDDVQGTYRPDFGAEVFDTLTFYIKDLKIGDAPQVQTALMLSVFPLKGLTAQLVLKSYANYYAGWDPFSRTSGGDRRQSWRIPDYELIDFHAVYDLPFNLAGVRLQAFAHVFNLLDTAYIQDATDNSAYNAWDYDHDADDAEVFFGIPRSFNVGLTVRF
ncbi:MAG: TonB-dependent receptor plug domain-containing protein, partial [Candidatus Neomarinimicrobiota bacterium]